jgi:hypothetical protein
VQGSYAYIGVQRQESCACHFYPCDISAPWDNSNIDGPLNHTPAVTFELSDSVPDTYLRYPTPCQILQPVGLTAVHATIPDTFAIPATIHILFQPDIYTAFRPSSDTLRLVLPGEAREENVFSTHSGNCILVCILTAPQDESLEGANPQLHIIRFAKGPPASIRVRRLPIPVFVESELEADKICSMAVDDHLGVLYMTNEQGFIFGVPYA